MWTLLLVLLGSFSSIYSARTLQDLLPFGDNYQGSANEIKTNHHNNFAREHLDGFELLRASFLLPSFKIFGADIGRNVYVNYNGHITFGNSHKAHNPSTFNGTDSSITALFAPFYSDNDPRRPPSFIYSRLSTDTNDLNRANTMIREKGFTSFSSSYCVVATWENLKYYVQDEDKRNNTEFFEQNTYQAILCTDGNDGHVIYQYVKLEWGRSQASSTNDPITGWHVKAAADPNLRLWVAPTSATDVLRSTLLTSSNVDVPGLWMRSRSIPDICAGKSDGYYASDCTKYYYCCNEKLNRQGTCPEGTNFHPFSRKCVAKESYPCGASSSNYCDGRLNGRYQILNNAFMECTSQTSRYFVCPHSFLFGTLRCQ